MSELVGTSKLQKWVKNAQQIKLTKITESKKHNKEIQKENTIDIDDFMIELDLNE